VQDIGDHPTIIDTFNQASCPASRSVRSHHLCRRRFTHGSVSHVGSIRERSGAPIAAPRNDEYRDQLNSHEQGEMGDGGLEAVLLANRDALLRFIRARGGHGDAEDLFQELWLKLSGLSPGPIADPLAYLYRAADNMMHDRRRANVRRERRETAWSDPAGELSAEASTEPSAERVMIARDELIRVDRALADLGERTESIFRRFRVDGVSQKTIAGEQAISLSAVEKHLQRAYRAIMALRSRDGAASPDAGRTTSRRPDSEVVEDAAR